MKSSRTLPVILMLLTLLLAVTLAGCGTQPAGPGQSATSTSSPSATQTPAPTGEPASEDTQTPVASHGGSAQDYVSLIDNLRALGATVDPAGEISQPFFSVKGSLIKVNGADVQVYEYLDATAAERDAVKVSLDGGSVGTSMVSWVGTPHFFKAGKIIALYVGDNGNVLNVLQQVLGTQFAGS